MWLVWQKIVSNWDIFTGICELTGLWVRLLGFLSSKCDCCRFWYHFEARLWLVILKIIKRFKCEKY